VQKRFREQCSISRVDRRLLTLTGNGVVVVVIDYSSRRALHAGERYNARTDLMPSCPVSLCDYYCVGVA